MDKSALKRFFSNNSNQEERRTIISWLLDPTNDSFIKNWMKANWDLIQDLDPCNYSDYPNVEKIWLNIRENIDDNNEIILPAYAQKSILTNTFQKKWWQLAAAAIFIISFCSFFWIYHLQNRKTLIETTHLQQPADIAPPDNKNKAVLTLTDGSKVYLDSSGNGILAIQGGVNVMKNNKGAIVYSGSSDKIEQYNTLSVPKGSRPVSLVLADGSLVWLNSASSITYPTAFTQKERKVTITGEAYFEVAKNTNMPFYVSRNDVMVQVLGTHFNVNTYEDENNVKITLLEGSVNVTKGNKTSTITPGQQANVSSQQITVISNIDIETVMAWKYNEFYFNGSDIKTIMRQIEKYYNVEIEYRDIIPYQFVAKISRQVNVSEFLKILELTNLIHFKIEANKIIVMK